MPFNYKMKFKNLLNMILIESTDTQFKINLTLPEFFVLQTITNRFASI